MDILNFCIHEGLRAVLSELAAGFEGLAATVSPGRFTGEFNVKVYSDGVAAHMKVFCGRPPYRGWVEIFNVEPSIFLQVEDVVYRVVSRGLKAGEPLYVEYHWDLETLKLLDMGAPPQVTRIGFKLLREGFTWFKTWYYPEGFIEGNVKIQAEKPVDEKSMSRHLEEACREVRNFLEKWREQPPQALKGAIERSLELENSYAPMLRLFSVC
ncbi:MAG: DUF1122 family protein [Thermoprotei archaeon]|nr:DUF1122 family protein [Thermoprotei archaeon]